MNNNMMNKINMQPGLEDEEEIGNPNSLEQAAKEEGGQDGFMSFLQELAMQTLGGKMLGGAFPIMGGGMPQGALQQMLGGGMLGGGNTQGGK